MSFSNLKIATKNGLVLLMMAALTVTVIVVAAIQLRAITATYSLLVSHQSPAMVRSARAARMATAVGYDGYRTIVYDGASREAQEAKRATSRDAAQVDQLLDEAKALAPDHAAGLDGFRRRVDALAVIAKEAAEHGARNDNAYAAARMKELDQQLPQVLTDFTKYNNAWMQANDEASAANAAKVASSVTLFLVLGGGGTAVIVALGLWLSRRTIANPLVDMTEQMKALAGGDLGVEVRGRKRRDEIGDMAGAVQVFKDAGLEKVRLEGERQAAAAELAKVVDALADGLGRLSNGDLTHRVDQTFAAEYERLRHDFNDAMGKLQQAMSSVLENTGSIGSGSVQISDAADDLSKRTEQQAAGLEETAAALDQITATVRKTAEGAEHAREVVSSAKRDAETSSEVVRRAVEAMSAIERSSQQIGQIIGVIDEIAFQTNLLALNAGVEAARAGDAGKGFAVVASEVRALAQRSAEAAKEIKGLINTSTEQVSGGVKLVGDTGEALNRIAAQVAEINGIVTDIAASAQEQATGLHQVNTAVNQMDQVTQQNAAMVEESTAASHALAREADSLRRLMGQFSIGAGAARPAEAAAAIPASPAREQQKRVANAFATQGATALKTEQWEEF